jgi:hypothetical protein
LSKGDFGKPNEDHDFTGSAKYVPDCAIKAGQILVPSGFRPPWQRMKPAGKNPEGPVWVAKHDVDPARGHRVGIATKWAVIRADTKAAKDTPVFVDDAGNWTIERATGRRQVGKILEDGSVLLSPGDYPQAQPESTPNREPDTQAKGNQKPVPPRK